MPAALQAVPAFPKRTRSDLARFERRDKAISGATGGPSAGRITDQLLKKKEEKMTKHVQLSLQEFFAARRAEARYARDDG